MKNRLLFLLVLGWLPATTGWAQFNRTQYPTYPQQGYRIVQPGTPVAPNPANNAVPAIPVGSNYSANLPWFAKLTDQREHDFGTVARASTQEHVFEFENNTGDDLFLTSVRASCGCTLPKILTPHVKPGETAKVQAKFDTLNFYGQKGATVTVSLRKSGATIELAELQLAVKGRIRRDVVLSPGQFEFPDVVSNEPAQQTAKVLYAGSPDWKIVDVKSTSPHITAETRELERSSETGRVTYEMIVKVDQASTGPFAETLTILTNDAKTTNMPVAVAGNVKPLIEVAPVTLGVINEGQRIEKKLIVRSPEAFTIEQIEANHPKIKFSLAEGKKSLHILTYTLDTSEPLEIDQMITITTLDSEKRTTQIPFSVQVVPATTTGNSSR